MRPCRRWSYIILGLAAGFIAVAVAAQAIRIAAMTSWVTTAPIACRNARRGGVRGEAAYRRLPTAGKRSSKA